MYSLNGEPFNARTGAHARARTDTLGHAHMHTNKDSGGGGGGKGAVGGWGDMRRADPDSAAQCHRTFEPRESESCTGSESISSRSELVIVGAGVGEGVGGGGRALIDWLGFFFPFFSPFCEVALVLVS